MVHKRFQLDFPKGSIEVQFDVEYNSPETSIRNLNIHSDYTNSIPPDPLFEFINGNYKLVYHYQKKENDKIRNLTEILKNEETDSIIKEILRIKNEIIIEFDGYWREENKSNVPKSPGIFCIYECLYNDYSKKIDFYKLLFIGESDNINQSINKNEILNEVSPIVREGNEICYSSAIVKDQGERDLLIGPLIKKNQPELYFNEINGIALKQFRIISKGKTALLNTDFEV